MCRGSETQLHVTKKLNWLYQCARGYIKKLLAGTVVCVVKTRFNNNLRGKLCGEMAPYATLIYAVYNTAIWGYWRLLITPGARTVTVLDCFSAWQVLFRPCIGGGGGWFDAFFWNGESSIVTRWHSNVGPMSGQRRWRWPVIGPALHPSWASDHHLRLSTDKPHIALDLSAPRTNSRGTAAIIKDTVFSYMLPCKAERQYLLTLQVSRYWH